MSTSTQLKITYLQSETIFNIEKIISIIILNSLLFFRSLLYSHILLVQINHFITINMHNSYDSLFIYFLILRIAERYIWKYYV